MSIQCIPNDKDKITSCPILFPTPISIGHTQAESLFEKQPYKHK